MSTGKILRGKLVNSRGYFKKWVFIAASYNVLATILFNFLKFNKCSVQSKRFQAILSVLFIHARCHCSLHSSHNNYKTMFLLHHHNSYILCFKEKITNKKYIPNFRFMLRASLANLARSTICKIQNKMLQ